ncbi:MAG TPA: ATP-binding protein [Trinickia sp.]|uniref:hybrid sensor histidine kinase/response regulator n=1 Tax=Trinickia sp. TaxID=2571163 RepID=UPI002C6F9632|nr:ATP-binding protein [Trinickia sp.]HVW52043.1 ATP-binding protein [Trinickia sp.]
MSDHSRGRSPESRDAPSNGAEVRFDGAHASAALDGERHTDDAGQPLIAQLERELQRTREQLQAANEALRIVKAELSAKSEETSKINDEVERRRDEFLAVVSHELKHPLNLISANTELIARSAEAHGNSAIARAADTIRRTVLGQAQIIDDLLDMSRLRTGKLSITRRPVDLKEVVQRICHTMHDEAQRKDVDFRLSVPSEPVSVNADLTRIEQIVWNLVSNALKFTDGDGKIAVQLSIDEHDAVLSVTDSGVGIDPATLPHIFEMYRQSRVTATAVRGGLGIGLSLVKELVAIHGGQVRAHSEGIGRGATFTVKLPRIVETVPDAAGGPNSTAFLRGERVLIVDDDDETLEAFKLLLEMEGAAVTIATNGEEALESLGKLTPSVILSDLGMPGMSGLEFIQAVRRRPEFASIKAIALSGFGRTSDVEEAARAGFDAHLTKPVMLDALLSAIAQVQTKPRSAAP